MNRISSSTLNEALSALGAFLEEANAEPESFVLIGGSALLALGYKGYERITHQL